MNYEEARKQIVRGVTGFKARAARRKSWPENTRYVTTRVDGVLMLIWGVQTLDGACGIMTVPAETPFYSWNGYDVLSLTDEDRKADDWELMIDGELEWSMDFGRKILFCSTATRTLE